MYFVHPQIKLKDIAKAKLALIKRPDIAKITGELSSYLPDKQFVFTDMGRSAFKLAIEKMNLRDSEMLLPAYICDIFYPILRSYNIKPIFLDVDLKTFHVRTEDIKDKITPETKSILVCHTYGLPADIPAVRKEVGDKVTIIEDCAHAFFAKKNGTYAGNFGDISFFSLYKQFPALRGGMLACPKDWEISLPETRFNLRDLISFLNHIPVFALFFKKFGSEIAPKMPRKEKLPEPAGLNRASLSLFSSFFKEIGDSMDNRKRLAMIFREGLVNMGFEAQDAQDSVFCYLSAMVPEELAEKRDEIVEKLRNYGVFCTRIWHTPIVLNKDAQEDYDINLEDTPNTVKAAKRIINFPLQNQYKENDIRKMVAAVKKVISEL